MVRHNICIESAIKFRLARPENRVRAREYIQHGEIILLLPWLCAHTPKTGIERKSVFDQLCEAKGIPHAANVAVYHDGRRLDDRAAFPATDLFSKIDGSYGGSEGRAWSYDAAQETWRNREAILDAQSLDLHFQSMSSGGQIVVQTRLTNADTLAPLSNGYLCTSRVVVIRAPGTAPRVLRAAFRMPVGDTQVDNFVSGGLAAIVDDTGRLSQAIQKKRGAHPVARHPDSGAQIQGYRIYGWSSVTDLALRAHEALTDLPTVGWDIALTPDGPVVEANIGWCAEILQMPESAPLGAPFAEFFEEATRSRPAASAA